MNAKWMISLALAAMITSSSMAQPVSKDSINDLKQQKEALSVAKKLNDRKLKLAALENSVEKKTLDMQNTAREAQDAANNNAAAANRLTDNSQNKMLAKEADRSAGSAKKDVKKARKAAKDLDRTQKNIDKLKDQIAKDEAKLAAMQPQPAPGN